jgi:two-component system sensor histidine kinase KdpD
MKKFEGWRRDGAAVVLSLVAVAGVVVSLRYAQAQPNPTISALLLLLVVLGTATTAPLRVAIATSVAAMLAFNFFLLPPFYTLTIADPQNWVALFVFVVVAIVASQLSSGMRQRAREAESRKREVTRLFDLSRDILLTDDSESAVADVARYVARRFELRGFAICLPGKTGWQVHQGSEYLVEPPPEQLDRIFAGLQGPLEYDARQRAYGGHATIAASDDPVALVPLRLGTRPVGLLAAVGADLDVGTLDAVGGVVAIAIERAHFLAERQKAELANQQAALASALLAAFSHDLRTPVTSIRVAVTNLQDLSLTPEERRAQADLAVQELDRLTRLFQDILDMGRIQGSAVNADPGWVSLNEVVEAAVAYAGPVLADRKLQIEADQSHEVQLDPRLTSVALAHVLENAASYSPHAGPISVVASVSDDAATFVVEDRGAGLDATDIEHLFEPFYRGKKTRHGTGTGLGLAITRGLLAAEGGRIWGENVPAGGARFTIRVPASTRQLALQES